MYFVCTREEEDCKELYGGAWGYYRNKEDAIDAVHRNVTDIHFSQVKDPITGLLGYRFIGFFIGDHYDENGMITYKRIDDKFKIIKK